MGYAVPNLTPKLAPKHVHLLFNLYKHQVIPKITRDFQRALCPFRDKALAVVLEANLVGHLDLEVNLVANLEVLDLEANLVGNLEVLDLEDNLANGHLEVLANLVNLVGHLEVLANLVDNLVAFLDRQDHKGHHHHQDLNNLQTLYHKGHQHHQDLKNPHQPLLPQPHLLLRNLTQPLYNQTM
jgi:hypothetical protein